MNITEKALGLLAVTGIVVGGLVLALPTAQATTDSVATAGRQHTAVPARVAKPQALPTCAYEGPIRSDINNYMTDAGGGNGSGVYTARPTILETWCVQRASEGGYYLLPVSAGGSLCLDGGTQNVGTVVQLWTCNGTLDQRWCWNGAGYLVRPNEAAVAAKDNGIGNFVTLASGNANKWYVVSGSIPDSC